MGRTVYRRMDILKQIADAVTGIGEKVFITDRPAAEQKAMKDFVVIRLPQTIQDKGSTYQDTYCQIKRFLRMIAQTVLRIQSVWMKCKWKWFQNFQ